MAELNIYLDQLTSTEVFQLLNKAAQTHKGQFLESIRVILPDTLPFQFVTLELPDPTATGFEKSLQSRYKDVFDAMLSGFKEITGRSEALHHPGGETHDLLEGMAWLMLKSALIPGDQYAEMDPTQYFIISNPIDDQEGESLFKQLSFHATYLRVSSVSVPNSGKNKFTRFLFHVKDDPKRKSSFQSAVSSGILKNCALLQAFKQEGMMVFLPPETTLGEATLKQFLLLFETAPLLFSQRKGDRPEKDENFNLTAAILQSQVQEESKNNDEDRKDRDEKTIPLTLEFYYLRNLIFYGEERFTFRKAQQATFSYLDLETSQESLEQLTQSIQKAQPFVGYRLELKATDHIDKNRIERLTEQKARIDYQLAYLKSVSRPRPLLMRFNRKQLPALAAEIRSFPLHAVIEGCIKYGFQATEDEPTGFHFLFIDPAETARLEMDPYPLWCDLDILHTRFRLDPFWANHYFDAWGMGEAMVFVPEGCTLYPPLHSWEPRSMDQYLKDTMQTWSQNLPGNTTVSIPEQPIYIFDGQPTPDHPISISILDHQQLLPLHTRLGWLNDNLVINQAIENENLFTEISKDLTWKYTAEKIAAEKKKTMEEFEQVAVSAAKEMAETAAEMTGVLNAEVNRVVRDSFRLTEKIRRTDERLKEWNEICQEMEMLQKEVHQEWQRLNQQKNQSQNEFWKIEQEIQTELELAESRRKEMQAQLDEEIKKMQITNRQLKRRLKSIKL